MAPVSPFVGARGRNRGAPSTSFRRTSPRVSRLRVPIIRVRGVGGHRGSAESPERAPAGPYRFSGVAIRRFWSCAFGFCIMAATTGGVISHLSASARPRHLCADRHTSMVIIAGIAPIVPLRREYGCIHHSVTRDCLGLRVVSRAARVRAS